MNLDDECKILLLNVLPKMFEHFIVKEEIYNYF